MQDSTKSTRHAFIRRGATTGSGPIALAGIGVPPSRRFASAVAQDANTEGTGVAGSPVPGATPGDVTDLVWCSVENGPLHLCDRPGTERAILATYQSGAVSMLHSGDQRPADGYTRGEISMTAGQATGRMAVELLNLNPSAGADSWKPTSRSPRTISICSMAMGPIT